MYYISPLTYIIGGIAATGLHEMSISCSENEQITMDPPPNSTCGEYLREYLNQHWGELYNPSARTQCQYCSVSNADQFLSNVGISWSNRWRNFGIIWGYVMFNCLAALLLYYGFRVKRWKLGSHNAVGWVRDMPEQMLAPFCRAFRRLKRTQ
jgi:ABC-type multidrug transport system permease subunit